MLAGSGGKKLEDWVAWLAGDGPAACRVCRKARKSDSACDRCDEPELLEENEPAVALYMRSMTQWRYAPNGAITGLDYTGMREVATVLGLEWGRALFYKIQVIERAWIRHDREAR